MKSARVVKCVAIRNTRSGKARAKFSEGRKGTKGVPTLIARDEGCCGVKKILNTGV